MNTRKHMILLIKQGLWTNKVLRHEQVVDKTKRGWNQNQKELCKHDQIELVIFLQQEQAPFSNSGKIPLQSAFPQHLLQKCWIVLRLLTMFAPYFFGSSRCWGLIESDELGRRTFTRGIS
jgi:hypothetical protein